MQHVRCPDNFGFIPNGFHASPAGHGMMGRQRRYPEAFPPRSTTAARYERNAVSGKHIQLVADQRAAAIPDRRADAGVLPRAAEVHHFPTLMDRLPSSAEDVLAPVYPAVEVVAGP